MPKTTSMNRRERQKAETRADLLSAAHALVKEVGYEGLTIRKLAERVGYATMSVYSYFPDKHAILLAIARDAFAELARRMDRDAPSDPVEALKMLMRAYAAFGLENPNEYRTVFMTVDPVHDPDNPSVEMTKENPALQLLLARVHACIDAGYFSGDAHAIATLIWTFGHGTVSLLITFTHYPFGDRDTFVERSIDLALAGLTKGPVPPLPGAEPGC
jgi:AcrR family transcriptional regulator